MKFNKKIYICSWLALLFSFCLFMAGCGDKVQEDQIIAKIGDSTITVEDFETRIDNLPDSYKVLIKKRKDEFMDNIVNDTLLYRAAVRAGLDKNEDVQRTIEAAKTKIVIARYLKDEVDDAVELTDEDIQKEYDDNKNSYMTHEFMRVSHILVPSRQKAEEILGELKQGVPFADMARAKSVDPTAQSGGDIGYFPKGQLMPEFERACESLEPGQISGIVKTRLGYHIILLTDRKPPVVKPLKDVRSTIENTLRKKRRNERFNDLLKKLRKETVVEINKKALEGVGESSKQEEE